MKANKPTHNDNAEKHRQISVSDGVIGGGRHLASRRGDKQRRRGAGIVAAANAGGVTAVQAAVRWASGYARCSRGMPGSALLPPITGPAKTVVRRQAQRRFRSRRAHKQKRHSLV